MDKKLPFDLSIPRYKELLEGGKPTTYYVVTIQKRANERWEVEHRYKEFSELSDALKKTHANLPSIPGKTLFSLKDHNSLENRREGLEKFLRALISRQDILNNDAVKRFLHLENYAPEATVHPPKDLGELAGMVYGVRDFAYEPKKGLMIMATGDMSVTSRVDSYLTNMKMPWEKDQPKGALVTVGTVECYIQQDLGVFKFEKLWTKTFQVQVITIFWEEQASLLAIGQDDGGVTVIKVLAELNFIKYDDVISSKIHTGRVMGVYVDSSTGLLYSVGEDKKFKIFDYVKNDVVADLAPGTSEFTALVAHVEAKRIFLANRAGQVYAYDISTTVPRLLHIIQAHGKGDIRGLDFDSNRNYVFTANMTDGGLSIWDIGKPGKEKYASNLANLHGKPKVRVCKWANARQELVSGNQDGTVTFWDAKKVEPIYVLHAHTSAITQMMWMDKDQVLLTASKDKKIKFWRLPDEWRDRSLVEQEEREYRIKKENESMIKFKEQQQKAAEDSDEDDLVGWHQ